MEGVSLSTPVETSMTDEEAPRSAVSDDLDVPNEQPTEEDDDHILPLEDLRYPTLSFSKGSISPETGIHLADTLDRAAIQGVLGDLDDALTSHDLCVEGPSSRAIFGLGPGSVSVDFTPDEEHLGTLSITIDLKAKALTYADADAIEVGARGGRGFIPKGMLTGEIAPGEARCYNWIDEPATHLTETESTETDEHNEE